MKSIIITIIVTIASTVALILVISNAGTSPVNESAGQAIVVDDTQVVEIKAKGGYSPRVTTAKAGIPTIIKVTTAGTFDCSAALTIPALGYSKHLPPSGITTIEVPAQQPNTVIQGICSMGMYSFAVRFV